MRKILLFTICLASCLLSCSVPKNGIVQNNEAKEITADSSQVVYNDSIDKIIKNAKTVILYDMANPVNEDSVAERHDSLLYFAIEKKVGKVKEKQLDVLRFILSDSKMFIKKYAPIRQPFMPNIGLVFKDKKQTVYIFVSFGTHEITITDETGNYKYYLMRASRLVERWASHYFPNNPYYELLLNDEYDEKN